MELSDFANTEKKKKTKTKDYPHREMIENSVDVGKSH